MIKNLRRWHRTLGLYTFFAGILLGMFFAALLTWADFEAFLFDARRDTGAVGLENLRCPVLLNQHETGVVSATFANPSESTRRRTVDAHISHGFVILMREERARFDLEPGEKRTLEWTISPEDAAWGRYILVRIHVQRNTPLPARSGSCGVLVVDLPFGTGAQITAVAVSLSLLMMAAGAALWLHAMKAQGKARRTVDYLALGLGPVTVLALIFSMTGLWLGSALLLGLTILTIVTIVTWVLS